MGPCFQLISEVKCFYCLISSLFPQCPCIFPCLTGDFPDENLRGTRQKAGACTDLWVHSFLTCSRVSFASAARDTSQGELLSCKETPLLYPPGMTRLLKYCIPIPALPSVGRFIFGTSVQWPNWFYFHFLHECFSCSIAILPTLFLLFPPLLYFLLIIKKVSEKLTT